MGFKALTVNTEASADAHIYAEDDAAIYQAIFGSDGVMNIGNKFAATVLSNNKVRVSDGVLCVGGHIGRMQYADYADLTIENGVSGKNRNDIIYAKFVTSGDVDSYVLDVRKGTAGTTATDPAMTKGNLYQGDALREYPLWRVKIEGLSIVKVEQLFNVIPTIPELKQEIVALNSNLTDIKVLSTTDYITCTNCEIDTNFSGNIFVIGKRLCILSFALMNMQSGGNVGFTVNDKLKPINTVSVLRNSANTAIALNILGIALGYYNTSDVGQDGYEQINVVYPLLTEWID